MIRAVLFDLDDTLFDHLHSCRCGLATLHQQHICFQQRPLPALEQTHYDLLEALHNEVLQGRRSLDNARQERFRQLFAAYGEQLAEGQLTAITANYRDVYQANRQLVPGARQLLARLRDQKIRIGVITNNMLAEQIEKLAHLGLAELVDVLVTSEEVGVAKPAPAIFEAALTRLGCTAPEVVMVGDSWTADILGANRLGIRSIWLNRFLVACPDPSLATAITGFEPVEEAARLILQQTTPEVIPNLLPTRN